MTSVLTWLHLSDLHARQDTDWDARRVLKSLREDLERLADRDDLRPELIFFTGDAAFGNLSGAPIVEQFDIAFGFFEELRKLFNIERRNVFLVPGNHDVDRSAILGQSTDWLEARIEAHDLQGVQRLYQGGVDPTRIDSLLSLIVSCFSNKEIGLFRRTCGLVSSVVGVTD